MLGLGSHRGPQKDAASEELSVIWAWGEIYHKPGEFKQQEPVPSQFWGPEVWGGCGPPAVPPPRRLSGGSRGHCSALSLWWLLASLVLWPQYCSVCIHSHRASLPLPTYSVHCLQTCCLSLLKKTHGPPGQSDERPAHKPLPRLSEAHRSRGWS